MTLCVRERSQSRREAALYSTIAAGIDGIEAWHPDHSPDDTDRLVELARKNRLLLTGGGDCHGGRKKGKIYLGEVTVPYKYLAAIKRLSRQRKG
jgi:predicted metal-dependent phosphoesterase TrpH